MIEEKRWGGYKEFYVGLASESSETNNMYYQRLIEDYELFVNLVMPIFLSYFISKCWNIVITGNNASALLGIDPMSSIKSGDFIYLITLMNGVELDKYEVMDGVFLDEENIPTVEAIECNTHINGIYAPCGTFYFKDRRYDAPEEIEKERIKRCQMKAVLITKTNQLQS